METTEDVKGVSDIDVSDNGQHQPAVQANRSGVTLIPHPSNDPLDPLVCAVPYSYCLTQDAFLNHITELADEQEA